jgi:hypothetical protein
MTAHPATDCVASQVTGGITSSHEDACIERIEGGFDTVESSQADGVGWFPTT